MTSTNTPHPPIITLEELRLLALRAVGLINAIYLHWTAGYYNQCFDDYHLNIGRDGEIFLTCKELTDYKAHTWHRNSHAVAISLCCCLDARAGYQQGNAPPNIDFGSFPPTPKQIERMAQIIAVLTDAWDLDISEEIVMTHQEAATLDNYGPGSGDAQTRWDLWYLPDRPLTEQLVQGGRVLRGKALWYRSRFLAQEKEKDEWQSLLTSTAN